MDTSRRNILLAIGGSATAGGALFGTQAFSTITADRTARVEVVGDGEALLVLEPVPGEERPGEETDGNNNAYAREFEGELDVNVDGYDGSGDTNASEGVNPNAVTRIPEVFRVGNQGTQEVEVSITPYQSESKSTVVTDVVFYNEDSNQGAGNSSNVDGKTLSPGDTGENALVVGIDIDTTDSNDIQLSVIEIEAVATGQRGS